MRESSGMQLRITITRERDTIVVTLLGDLDVYAASAAWGHFDEAIDRAAAHALRRLVVDAGGLSFCDSTGLSVIVRAQHAAQGRDVQFSISRASTALRDLLALTGLDTLITSNPNPA